MKIKMTQKFIASICGALIASMIVAPLVPAQAFIVYDPKNGILNHIFHGITLGKQTVANISLGLPGSGAAARAGVKGSKVPCKALEKALKVTDTIKDAGSVATAVGGTPAEIANLDIQIASLTAVQNCYEALLAGSEAAGTAAAASGIQAIIAVAGNETLLQLRIEANQQKIDRLRERRSEAVKALWRGVALRILNNVQIKLTLDMTNKILSKYKIGNYIGFASSLAGQVYAKNYLKQKYGKNGDQMVMRSLMNESDQLFAGGRVLGAVSMRAKDNAGGILPSELDISDDNFYQLATRIGSANADPYLLAINMQGQADEAKEAAASAAKAETDSGQGYMPQYDCSYASGKQEEIDKQNIKLSHEVRVNEEILWKLKEQSVVASAAKTLASVGGNIEPAMLEEIAKAEKALADSQAKLKALESGSPAIVEYCKLMKPGKAIADFNTTFLSSHLGNLNKASGENMGFFPSFVEQIASNFLTKLIEGEKPNLNMLTAGGYQAVNLGINDLFPADNAALKSAEDGDYVVHITRNADNVNQVIIKWDFSYMNEKPDYINITGAGIPVSAIVQQKSGSYTFTNPLAGTYVFKVYKNTSDPKNPKLLRTVESKIAAKDSALPPPPVIDTKPPAPPASTLDWLDDLTKNLPKPPLGEVPPDEGTGGGAGTGTGTDPDPFTSNINSDQPRVAGAFTSKASPRGIVEPLRPRGK